MIPIFTKPRWGTGPSSSNSTQSNKHRLSVNPRLSEPKSLNNSVSQSPPRMSSVESPVPPCESIEMLNFPVVIVAPLTEAALAAHTKITNPHESKRCTRCRHCKRVMKPAHVTKSYPTPSPHHVPVAQSVTVTARSTSTGSRSLSTMSKSQLSSSQSRSTSRPHTSSSSKSKALNAGKESPRWAILLDSILSQSLI